MTYGTQQILLDRTAKLAGLEKRAIDVPVDFLENGFTLLSDIPTPEAAEATLNDFIVAMGERLPFHRRVADRVQLLKADPIPMCASSVCSFCQALHFDMGQPFWSAEPQLMFTMIGLYFPAGTEPGTTRTRVLPLKGLLDDARWKRGEDWETRLLSYVKAHGDGWKEENTHRLACFARVLDALDGNTDLVDYRDKTMAYWFSGADATNGERSMANEQEYFRKKGVDLATRETHVTLKPGELLIVDNTRAAHGRIGNRREKEIFQFLYGLKAEPEDIDAFRTTLLGELFA